MWQGVVGHDAVADRFRRMIAAGRLASTYLLVGPKGIGKRTFAERLAGALLCSGAEPAALERCGGCDSCRLLESGSHPDLDIVQLPEGKRSLSVDLFVGDRDHRNRVGLCHNLSLKPQLARRRVAIIDDADRLTTESSNALLKTLEEPPPGAVLLLISESRSRMLTTILSRCQLIRMDSLAEEEVAEVLRREQLLDDTARADELAQLSGGSVGQAVLQADADLGPMRARLLEALSPGGGVGVLFAKELNEFVAAGGKEAEAKRRRLRVLLSTAAERLREALRASPAEERRALESLEATLQAEEYLDRNANLNSLVDWWAGRLGAAGR